MTLTFFGHRKVSDEIEEILKTTLTDLIVKRNVDTFYVGNQGEFDYIVRKNLKSFKEVYPNIKYAVVLAYLPTQKTETDFYDNYETIFPCGLENVPPKYAISKRNLWMLENSDIIVTYVTRTIGGAAQFEELASKKGKEIINLADYKN